jgi:hypothetical protein
MGETPKSSGKASGEESPGVLLILWGVVLFLFSGCLMPASPSPGWVAWPLWVLVVASPVGVILARRRGATTWQLVIYSAIASAWFAIALVFMGRNLGKVVRLELWGWVAVVWATLYAVHGLAAVYLGAKPRRTGVGFWTSSARHTESIPGKVTDET